VVTAVATGSDWVGLRLLLLHALLPVPGNVGFHFHLCLPAFLALALNVMPVDSVFIAK
jgi:hypothetical protein